MRIHALFQGLLPLTFFNALVTSHPTADGGYYPTSNHCNTPQNRACWKPGYTINTDYEKSTPLTGVTRRYRFVITEKDNYVGADGVTRAKAMLINGQYPGPTIYADWGDRVEVEVINKLQTNGTGIHWHGVRQFHSNVHDGAPGVTECPIAPGHSKKYNFLVEQYGSSWYHTHFSAQYGYGINGAMVFNGPASANYDIDLGPFPINDWYYSSIDQILDRVMNPNTPFFPNAPGAPPPSDNVFFNGTNINPAGKGGKYAEVVIKPGKVHRLRLINLSVENTFTFSIVNHSMTIIETDFVPVTPKVVDSIYLSVGQRYDVLIHAKPKPGNYWMNVTFSTGGGGCGSSNNPYPAAILHYQGASNKLPTDRGTAPPDSLCADRLDFSPVVPRSAPLANLKPSDSLLPVNVDVEPTISKLYWKVNGTAINVDWDMPVLEYVEKHKTSFPANENIIKLPQANEWAFWIIENLTPIPHPMHIHGHDFLVLGASPAEASPAFGAPARLFTANDTASLKSKNPIRRDVTMLPALGWVAVAFLTDNPGAWLMHCHIAWHVSEGLSVDFLERANDIPKVMDLKVMDDNCAKWRAYYPSKDPYRKVDSGL